MHTTPPEAYEKPWAPGPQQKLRKDDEIAPKPGIIKRLKDTLPACVPGTISAQLLARLTAQERPSWLWFPGYRNVMFWLPVKGLAQWRHISFPVLSFLPLLSPLCFSQSALAAQGSRRCGALELKAQDSDLLEWSVGNCCHVGRSPEPRGENPGLGPTLPLRTNNASPPTA